MHKKQKNMNDDYDYKSTTSSIGIVAYAHTAHYKHAYISIVGGWIVFAF